MAEPLTERLDPVLLEEAAPRLPPSQARRYGHEDFRFWSPPTGWRAFAAAAAGSLLILISLRLGVQDQYGEVTGLDTGNWITLGHHWLGSGVDGAGSTYPPLVPVLAALMASAMAPQYVLMLLGALGTAVYGGAVAAVLWRAGAGWWALPLTIALAGGTAAGEPVAWGGVPQLIGLGLALLALWLVADLLADPRPRPAWLLGGVVLLLGATSHLVLAITAAASGLILLLRLTWRIPRPTWPSARRLAGTWIRVLLPCLPLIPLYLVLVSTVGESFAARREQQGTADFLAMVDHAVREFPLLWRPAIVASLLLPLALWGERRRPIWSVTAALSVLLTGLAVLSPEPRFAYVVPLLAVAAGGLLASAGRLLVQPAAHAVAASVTVTVLVASAVLGMLTFPQQVRHYGALVPEGTTEALQAMRASTEPDDVVLVPPVNGLPFGWWVEGYGRRAAFVGSSAQWLNFAAERERAGMSVDFFSKSDVLSSRWLAEVGVAGIDVVYVPSSYDGVPAETWNDIVRSQGELVVHASDAALVVRVP